MVMHGKPKSKRTTTRHRAKVIRKVREHGRKLKKGDASKRKRTQKDPGVPASFPKKEAFLVQLAEDKQAEKDHRIKNRNEAEKLKELLQDAETRGSVYTKLGKVDSSKSVITASVPDSSRKAYYREFKQVLEGSDVILQVLDARDPQGCRVEAVETAVREAGKKLVLVMNKTDLVPMVTVRAWLAHLRKDFPAVAFRSSVNSQKATLGTTVTANDCMGADQLISLLKNYARSHNIKTSITVGVVGYPNVGKSSLINSLKRSKVCRVGATPGITTVAQQVHLDRNINLLDCPGIVFSSNPDDTDLFLRNVLKVEQLEDPITPVMAILRRVSKEQLIVSFCCNWTFVEEENENTNAFLRSVATVHGRLKKGGVPDLESAARYVLNEWNSGKIKYWREPPVSATGTDTAIMSELGPEFKIEDLDSWLSEDPAAMDIEA